MARRCKHSKSIELIEYGGATTRHSYHAGAIDHDSSFGEYDGSLRVQCLEFFSARRQRPKWIQLLYAKVKEHEVRDPYYNGLH